VKDRLGVLDGLRGVAVLLVLWYHIWEISWQPAPATWLQFIPETGFIGVQLFFFLSGFVITYPFLQAQARGTRPPTWGHFAFRRFIKIAPSYLLSIAVAYAIGYAAKVNYAGTPVWQEVLSHLLFVHTWWQTTQGAINGVLWTLAVEVEFYLVFPFVWFAFKRWPWLTAALMIAISIAWRTWWAHTASGYVFSLMCYNLPAYLDMFACGMLCAWVFVHFGHRVRDSRWTWSMPAVAVAGWIMFGWLLVTIFANRLAPQWEQAGLIYTQGVYGVAFALIAFGSLCAPRVWQVLLANPPLRFLAVISYNLYLYHQLVARELLWRHVPPYAGDPHYDVNWQLQFTILAFAVTIVQAAIVTYIFERPIMRIPDPRHAAKVPGHSPGV
jgi:peptidoglycan/LPS O-acetylase OafA/YrhL